jgi:hypothetical protein
MTVTNSKKPSKPPQAPALAEACHVAALVDEARRLIAAYSAADKKSFDANTAFNAAEMSNDKESIEKTRRDEQLYDRMQDQTRAFLDSVEMRSSFVLTKSARGALFQLCVLADFVDELSGHIVPNEEAKEVAVAMRRLIYSVAGFIEHTTGESCEKACGDFYMSQRLNPFSTVDAALSLIEGEA